MNNAPNFTSSLRPGPTLPPCRADIALTAAARRVRRVAAAPFPGPAGTAQSPSPRLAVALVVSISPAGCGLDRCVAAPGRACISLLPPSVSPSFLLLYLPPSSFREPPPPLKDRCGAPPPRRPGRRADFWRGRRPCPAPRPPDTRIRDRACERRAVTVTGQRCSPGFWTFDPQDQRQPRMQSIIQIVPWSAVAIPVLCIFLAHGILMPSRSALPHSESPINSFWAAGVPAGPGL